MGIVYNRGMGGCKIVTDRPLTIGGMVTLISMFPSRPSPLRFEWQPCGGCCNVSSGWNFWVWRN